MKRDYPDYNPGSSSSSSSMAAAGKSTGKSKMFPEERDAGMDELLAVLGYKVRASDMQDVAQKLEQLEQAMGSVQESEITQITNETVHYNPSDLSNWLETMISELNGPPNLDQSFLPSIDSSTITSLGFENSTNQVFEEPSTSDYDLTAIPGKAVLGETRKIETESSASRKRVRTGSFSGSSAANPEFYSAAPPSTAAGAVIDFQGSSSESTRPVVLVDSQENGIRLVHTLMACAEAVQQNNLTLAEALVKQVGFLAVSQAGAMRKVATYFAEALARRIYGLYPQNPLDNSMSEILSMHFYETCPYLKFAHFTANQAILEAFEGKKRVHVIDFGINQGLQWPALMQALALRPGGPPTFRLTGIGPPAPDNSDRLQEVGWKLAQLAETVQIEFEYRGFVANSLADLDSSVLNLRPSEVEAVAVNSIFELHKLLNQPGALEKVLQIVKETKPEILTIVEQEANHNGPVFMDRFTESLHYYSTMFDSLEGSVNNEDKVMSEVYLGKQICNVVACEGVDRVERHETLAQWRTRLGSAGFVPAHLGSNAFKQASMLLALFAGGDGYRVEENNGCLMLGWHTRPLIATSAWRLGDRPGAGTGPGVVY